MRLFRELAGQLLNFRAINTAAHTQHCRATVFLRVWNKAPHVFCVRARTLRRGRDADQSVWTKIVGAGN